MAQEKGKPLIRWAGIPGHAEAHLGGTKNDPLPYRDKPNTKRQKEAAVTKPGELIEKPGSKMGVGGGLPLCGSS